MTDIDTDGLDEELAALVETAEATLHENFSGRHRTAAALRTADGEQHVGLHLDTTISSESIHAEATAVADAVLSSGSRRGAEQTGPTAEGGGSDADPETDDSDAPAERDDPEITAVVAVSKQSPDDEAVVIPPCGSCRELLADYAPDADVLVPGGGGAAAGGERSGDGPRVRPLADLLPSDVTAITDYPRFG